jgi:hypothetical protein
MEWRRCVDLYNVLTLLSKGISSSVSLRRPSIGFVATYDCNYDRFYRCFLSFYRLSLRLFIPNYERGEGDTDCLLTPFNIDFDVEALPPSDSALKTALHRMNGCLCVTH